MFRILMAVDADEELGRGEETYVESLGEVTESISITLLHVYTEIHAAEEAGDVDLREYADTPEAVTNVKADLEEAGFDVELQEVSGEPADEIVRMADEIDADNIVLGGRKRSRTGKLLFGSTSQSVILATNRPVTITGKMQ